MNWLRIDGRGDYPLGALDLRVASHGTAEVAQRLGQVELFCCVPSSCPVRRRAWQSLNATVFQDAFIQKVILSMASSGMLRRVALVKTDVSEELSASFIRVTRIGELGKR
jgi:hypothetical protein